MLTANINFAGRGGTVYLPRGERGRQMRKCAPGPTKSLLLMINIVFMAFSFFFCSHQSAKSGETSSLFSLQELFPSS